MFSIRLSAAALATTLFSMSVRSQIVYYIDPTSVPIQTRDQWCTTQETSCPLLCLQLPGSSSTTTANDCDPTTLTYDCVCGNGQSPNASEYSQTIPYFICQTYGDQCVAACNGDTACQNACRVDNPCGAQNPTRVNTTSSSTMSSTTVPAGATSTSGGVVFTGLGGAVATNSAGSSSSSSSAKSGAQTALDLGRSYGLVVIFSGLFAGFALVM